MILNTQTLIKEILIQESQEAVETFKIDNPNTTPDQLADVRASYVADRVSGKISKHLTITG